MNKSDIICADVSYFEDRETFVKINNYEKLANENILIVQSLSNNVNDSVIELLFVLDIVKNNNPKSINVLLTYMGYSRQDRIEVLNESFSAKIIAKLLSLRRQSRKIYIYFQPLLYTNSLYFRIQQTLKQAL